jgi:hypothetical protein
MRYFRRKSDGEVFGYDPDQLDLIAVAEQDDGMEDVTGSWPPPKEDFQETEESARRKRNRLLSSSDWTQLTDAPVDKAAWASYRQALRDVPQQTGFPQDVDWPVKP